MSNLKDSIKAIFQKFAIDPKAYGIELETEVMLETEIKLLDGTSIFTSADALAIGVDVYTKDNTGAKVPSMAGEYTIATGEVVSVNDMGQVEEIAMPEETQQEMSSQDLLNAIEKLSERVSTLEGENSTLAAELAAIKTEKENVAGQLNTTKAELSALKKQPAAVSVKENKTRVVLGAEKSEKPFSQMTLRERIVNNIEKIK